MDRFQIKKILGRHAKDFDLYPKPLEKCFCPHVSWHQMLGFVVFFLNLRTQVWNRGKEYDEFQAGACEGVWDGGQQRQRR